MHPQTSDQTTKLDSINTITHEEYTITMVVENLVVPWSIAFTSDERFLVTERPGRVRQVVNWGLINEAVYSINVSNKSEEGMMSIVLDPNYEINKFVYIAYAYPVNQEIQVKVVRLDDTGDALINEQVLIDQLPAAKNHAGTALAFGPDGKLYISVGDGLKAEMSQYPDFYHGKILRINPDGSIPNDNPLPDYATRTLWHRNIQWLDWNSAGHMYASEHGPSVFDGPPGGDEVNMIIKGQNYGWPVVSHEENQERMNNPIALFTPAIAPASLVVYDGDMFPMRKDHLLIGMLKGQGIIKIEISQEDPKQVLGIEQVVDDSYGRVRYVGIATDGSIYFTTSNEDGRGNNRDWWDKVYRISKE
jgi:aldose sugar dehydrogenase